MIWSQSEDEKKTNLDLESGLSHFPKTAAIGQNGNAIVSGHSSNYIWAKGNYNHVFKDLQTLEVGDKVNIKTVQQNGKVIFYQYIIKDKFISTPDDARIFADTDTPTLTLTTCWPVGTALKRTIIKAELVR
jgi:sortase A